MKRFSHILLLSLSIVLFNSCSVIEGIFKAGMWTGVVIVVAIIVGVIWIMSKLRGKRQD